MAWATTGYRVTIETHIDIEPHVIMEVRCLWEDKGIIPAIKYLRGEYQVTDSRGNVHNIGLKDAKDIVEHACAGVPRYIMPWV